MYPFYGARSNWRWYAANTSNLTEESVPTWAKTHEHEYERLKIRDRCPLFIYSVYTHLRVYFALTYQLVRRIRARRRHPHAHRSPHQPCPASARLWVSLQEYEINEKNEPRWKIELISQVFMPTTSRSDR